jgi:hypothetical protein
VILLVVSTVLAKLETLVYVSLEVAIPELAVKHLFATSILFNVVLEFVLLQMSATVPEPDLLVTTVLPQSAPNLAKTTELVSALKPAHALPVGSAINVKHHNAMNLSDVDQEPALPLKLANVPLDGQDSTAPFLAATHLVATMELATAQMPATAKISHGKAQLVPLQLVLQIVVTVETV